MDFPAVVLSSATALACCQIVLPIAFYPCGNWHLPTAFG
jgi:hypothetical protein